MHRFLSRFFQTASAQAQDTAVVDARLSLSYQQLVARVRTEALSLDALPEQSLVPLLLPRGIDFVVRLLALWLRGLVPVPLDPEIPEQRYREIQSLLSSSPEPRQSSIAYGIATSGSSGRPKLVWLGPDGLLPMLEAQIQSFQLGPGDRSLWMLSAGFDASLSDVLTTLLAGATLVCAPPNPAAMLPRLVRQYRITHLDIPPALLNIYQPSDFADHLRTIIVGGAPSPPELLRRWAQRFRVVAVYGPTEATICSSLSVVDDNWDAAYIGQPIGGLDYRVVEDELHIGGPGVALGYAAESRAIEPAFYVQDGLRWYRTGDRVRAGHHDRHGLIFVGRGDRQVQLNGQRVELDEVESRLHPILGSEVAVVAQQDSLTVYWVGEDRRGPAEACLAESLPKSWLPRHWCRLPELPRLLSGKIDYLALSSLPQPASEDSLSLVSRALQLERRGFPAQARRLLSGSAPSLETVALDAVVDQMLVGYSATTRPRSVAKSDRPMLLVTGSGGHLGRALLGPLREHFELLLLQHRKPLAELRCECIDGDLRRPRLGLSATAWQGLSERLSGVLNLAAQLDVAAPLEELLETNARPLRTLAGLGVPLHHASSMVIDLAVVPCPKILKAEGVASASEAKPAERILGAYAQSKWVAERLWHQLAAGGHAFRLGYLLGDPGPGDLLSLVVRGLLELGCYPQAGAQDLAFDATPIDFAAQAMVGFLRGQKDHQRVSLPISSGVKISLADIITTLAGLGYTPKAVSHDEFFAQPAPSGPAYIAKLALQRLHGERTNPEWDLFLMSDTEWPLATPKLSLERVHSSLREHLKPSLLGGL